VGGRQALDHWTKLTRSRIEIYDTAHELCFLLDANTNQWWVLKEDAIPAEQAQWLGDNVWNVVHGFDDGSWVRRSLQYRRGI